MVIESILETDRYQIQFDSLTKYRYYLLALLRTLHCIANYWEPATEFDILGTSSLAVFYFFLKISDIGRQICAATPVR